MGEGRQDYRDEQERKHLRNNRYGTTGSIKLKRAVIHRKGVNWVNKRSEIESRLGLNYGLACEGLLRTCYGGNATEPLGHFSAS